MGELTTLRKAVTDSVHDGDSVALEGFTHLIPFVAAHEIIRQDKEDLPLISIRSRTVLRNRANRQPRSQVLKGLATGP